MSQFSQNNSPCLNIIGSLPLAVTISVSLLTPRQHWWEHHQNFFEKIRDWHDCDWTELQLGHFGLISPTLMLMFYEIINPLHACLVSAMDANPLFYPQETLMTLQLTVPMGYSVAPTLSQRFCSDGNQLQREHAARVPIDSSYHAMRLAVHPSRLSSTVIISISTICLLPNSRLSVQILSATVSFPLR